MFVVGLDGALEGSPQGRKCFFVGGEFKSARVEDVRNAFLQTVMAVPHQEFFNGPLHGSAVPTTSRKSRPDLNSSSVMFRNMTLKKPVEASRKV